MNTAPVENSAKTHFATVQDIVRFVADPQRIWRLASFSHALLSTVRRSEDFGGNCYVAKTSAGRQLYQRAKDYEPAVISGEAMRACRGEARLLGTIVQEVVDDAVRKLGDRLSLSFFIQGAPAMSFRREVVGSELRAIEAGISMAALDSETQTVLEGEALVRSVDPNCEGFYVMHPARHERMIRLWRSKARKHGELPGTQFYANRGPRSYHVVPDTDCPMNVAWRFPYDALELASLGSVPQLLNSDGVFLRHRDDDSYEVFFGWYGNLVNLLPRETLRMEWK